MADEAATIPPTAIWKRIALTVLKCSSIVVVIYCGLITAFMSQASSSDYRKLFWATSPLAAITLLLAPSYFALVHDRTRWAVAAIGLLGIAGFAELAIRVWL
jgi:uncharacterized membrane protein